MVSQWQPGEQYNYGDVVVFQGVQYRIIQPHRSQGDWTPPVTPALWGRCETQDACCQEKQQQYGGDCQQGGQGYGQPPQQAQFQSGDQGQPAGAIQEQGEHHESHDKLKKFGGALAGVAALGLGYAAYKHHEHKKDEKNAQAWSGSIWFEESQVRTQQWRAGHYNQPAAWIWCEGKNIPPGAIQGGEERGGAIFICRAYYQGGLLVGKASRIFKKGAVIGFKKEEIHIDKYEILVGDSRAVKWVPTSGRLNLQSLRARPIEGGREPDGTPIYIAQAPHKGAVHPGKASELYGDGCFIPYDNTEVKVKEYAILCWTN